MNELDYENIVFFNLVTTGLNINSDIVQIGAIDAITGDTFERNVFFYDTETDLNLLSEKYGYDDEKWSKTGVELNEALADFSDFALKHSDKYATSKNNTWKTSILAGFNSTSFHKPILTKAFKNCEMFYPFDYRCFDVMQLAFWVYRGRTTYSLDSLLELEGIKKEGKGALSNAIACYNLAKKILSRSWHFFVEWH